MAEPRAHVSLFLRISPDLRARLDKARDYGDQWRRATLSNVAIQALSLGLDKLEAARIEAAAQSGTAPSGKSRKSRRAKATKRPRKGGR
jgi:hypothetical protein